MQWLVLHKLQNDYYNNLVNIHHLRTLFLKRRHFSSVFILNTWLEILNHFRCVNFAVRLKNQEQKAKARFPFKIPWFSKLSIHSSSLNFYITQKIVTLKGNRIEGWRIPYFFLRHSQRWYDKCKMLSGTKKEISRECSQPKVQSGRGPRMGITLHVVWTDCQEPRPLVPGLSVPAFLFHLTVGSLFFSVPYSPLSW